MSKIKKQPDFKPSMAWLLKNPWCFLGFGFGSGLAPKAPGTFGTLPALPITALLLTLGMSSIGIVILSVILFVVGIHICNVSEQKVGVEDYGGIVWDEIVAMMLILAFVPMTWTAWAIAFAVFRFFDAVKPWPIRWLDAHMSGGLGIMVDDILAAVFSLVVLFGLYASFGILVWSW